MLWNTAFECQIPHIDAQHKALFDHIELLGNMHGDLTRIPMTLEFLEKYTTEHFSDEESLHSQLRYPHALEHQRQHKDFINQMRKLKANYNASGHTLSTLMEMNHTLVDWLKAHILQTDKRFAEFYHGRTQETRDSVRLPHRPWIPDASQKASPETATHTLSGSWTDAMLCGIPHIDEQHKELFRQLDILQNRGNTERVPGVLRFLADYVVKHFNDEESLHLKSRFPGAAGHRKLHADFIDTFQQLKAKYEKSDKEFAAVMEINRVVYDWLKEHVLKVDKQFAKYYLELQENA